MKLKDIVPRSLPRALGPLAILAILALAGCPTAHQPPPPVEPPAAEPPPSGGVYQPPPEPAPRVGRPFRKAHFRGKAFCPRGSFFDPRSGGQCWSCEGRRRTALPVTSRKACLAPARKRQASAVRGKKTKVAPSCKSPWFWDAWRGGNCWSCPKGYRRGVSHINSKDACVRSVKARYTKAKFVANFGCRRGQFFDPRRGGQCWSCPAGYRRTSRRVTGERACRRR